MSLIIEGDSVRTASKLHLNKKERSPFIHSKIRLRRCDNSLLTHVDCRELRLRVGINWLDVGSS